MGATKRKERHLHEEQHKEETSKLPKANTLFNLQSQSQKLSSVPLGDSYIANSNELFAAVDSSFIEPEYQVLEVAEEQHTVIEKE